MKKILTVQNVTDKTAQEIFEILSAEYDNIFLPEEVITADDLTDIYQMLGKCTNIKSYLNTLYIHLDICTRAAKRKGKDAKLEYEDMVARKTVVKAYYDHIDDICKASSRQATVYFEQQKEIRLDQQINNMQYKQI